VSRVSVAVMLDCSVAELEAWKHTKVVLGLKHQPVTGGVVCDGAAGLVCYCHTCSAHLYIIYGVLEVIRLLNEAEKARHGSSSCTLFLLDACCCWWSAFEGPA